LRCARASKIGDARTFGAVRTNRERMYLIRMARIMTRKVSSSTRIVVVTDLEVNTERVTEEMGQDLRLSDQHLVGIRVQEKGQAKAEYEQIY
jgi:hypothetical protein